MKPKQVMIYGILTISSIIGMDTQAADERKNTGGAMSVHNLLRIELDKTHLPKYQEKFDPFVKKRRWQAKALSNWVGSIVASIFSDVNIDEARAYLGRVFEDEDALKRAAQKIDSDEESIAYLKTLLGNMNSHDIQTKNSAPLAGLMKRHKHPALAAKKDVKPWDKDQVNDDTFYRMAACSFMAYVIVEEGAPLAQDGDA